MTRIRGDSNGETAVSNINFKWLGLQERHVSDAIIDIEIGQSGLIFNSDAENAFSGLLIKKLHKAEFHRNPLFAQRSFKSIIAEECGLIDLATIATNHIRILNKNRAAGVAAKWSVINIAGRNVLVFAAHIDCRQYVWRIWRIPTFGCFRYRAHLTIVLCAYIITVWICAYIAADGHTIQFTTVKWWGDICYGDISLTGSVTQGIKTFGAKDHEFKIVEYQPFGLPGVKMVGNCNRTADFAPGFFEVAYTEYPAVLTVSWQCDLEKAFTNVYVVGRTVTLVAAISV